MASAMPIFSSENGLPVGPRTRAPLSRQRLASGMSAVMQMPPVSICSAIQLSASSAPSDTTIFSTNLPTSSRIHWLLTI